MKDIIEKSVARIEQYEPTLEACRRATEDFSGQLEAFAAMREKTAALAKYYGSEAWYEDCELYEQGRLPGGLKCGVLSEDLVYDVITENREIALRMLELATAILKTL